MQFLEFEQPIADLEAKIEALKQVNQKDEKLELNDEIKNLEAKLKKLVESVFSNLNDWQIIQLARHPERPYALDYIRSLFSEFEELHGDRNFGDDQAIIGGLASLEGLPVMVIGQQKGRSTKEKIKRNFGMPHPEGYRKALRLMKLAERFSIPVITLIDTPGAYPGVNAEARGQSEAIARNLKEMSALKVPIICVVIGEGCSGGALGIGVGDRFLMLNYSYFATISPEGCASILWKSADKASHAAEIMGITAPKLKKLKLIDDIIPEPLGGAHRDMNQMGSILKQALVKELKQLNKMDVNTLLDSRYQKIMKFGDFLEKK
ncbi:acetyl-CoA carboxylase carboxyltransferase subunit alpha [Thiotrichales bacterium 19S3-7]|nr:acetyl-CoA carboxylase carboxyltransferase subunit alpha [Thiotrichales bacterium 19S3-7]MCF6801986.1 acetyl-CoA carboxylase carboxyltransferase subunit alpha [Thiotrichales bacterium 19S3-11]